MSDTVKKTSTGSSFLGPNTIYNGSFNTDPCSFDYITITAYTGAGLGTGFFEVNLYDEHNSSTRDSFLDLRINQPASENFAVMRDVKRALHGVFTGAGAATVTIRK